MEIRREAQVDQFDSSVAIMQAGGVRGSRESWQGRLGPELDDFECHREEVFKNKYKKAIVTLSRAATSSDQCCWNPIGWIGKRRPHTHKNLLETVATEQMRFRSRV